MNPKEKILISFIILGARPTSTLGPKRDQLVFGCFLQGEGVIDVATPDACYSYCKAGHYCW